MSTQVALIERIKTALAEDAGLVDELGQEENVEMVAREHYDEWRWGTVWLTVYRDPDTKDLAGVIYRTQPEEGVYEDSIQVVPVRAEEVTTIKYKVAKA
jgi:uncharacterized protein YrzB (UPF0473 family)